MLKKISIILHYNLYESKRYFSYRLAEAFQRRGITVNLIDLDDNPAGHPAHFRFMGSRSNNDLTCSFNRVEIRTNEKPMWDFSKIPHIFFSVDPSFYYQDVFYSPYSIITCVDRNDLAEAMLKGAKNVLFMPHAIERELKVSPKEERPYDVVFLGSCYDHEMLPDFWKKELPSSYCQVIEKSCDAVLNEIETSIAQAVKRYVDEAHLSLLPAEMLKILEAVDFFTRGKDRVELIRSIKGATVHVFGGPGWREGPVIRGWFKELAGMPNVVIHPAIPFAESLNIIKQSKICLNSMPFFKDGSHERILTALGGGALPLTTENRWVRENFVEGEEVLFYRSGHWQEADEVVNRYLADPNLRVEAAMRGQQKVLQHHTWDQRVDVLLRELEPILQRISPEAP